MASAPVDGSSSQWSVSLGDTALLGFVTYVGLTVLRQSDAQLINPETKLSTNLGDFVEIPGGKVITPLLAIDIPLFCFYLIVPLAIICAHAALIWPRPADASAGARLPAALRIALPTLVLMLIAWKFAPYTEARPIGEAADSVGWWLRGWHTLTIAIDAVLVGAAVLGLADASRAEGGAAFCGQRHFARQLLVATQLTALVALGALGAAAWSDTALGTMTLGALLGLGTIVGLSVLADRPGFLAGATAGLLHHGSPHARRTVTSMIIVCISLLFPAVAIATTPPRAMDLSGARLVAREPSETVLAALMTGRKLDSKHDELRQARRAAWDAFGGGLDFTNWRFVGVSFQGASLQLVRFERTQLARANLAKANLSGAFLGGADLTAANLVGADLSNVRASEINLAQDSTTPTTPPGTPQGDAAPTVNLSLADLRGADLRGAKLMRADLHGADLRGAMMNAETDLTGADLQEAKLHKADLTAVRLRGAKINGADFCGANLVNVDLSLADWEAREFHGVKTKPSHALPSFDGADLNGVTLPESLSEISMEGANLYGLKFSPSGKAVLTGAKLCRAQALKENFDRNIDCDSKPPCQK